MIKWRTSVKRLGIICLLLAGSSHRFAQAQTLRHSAILKIEQTISLAEARSRMVPDPTPKFSHGYDRRTLWLDYRIPALSADQILVVKNQLLRHASAFGNQDSLQLISTFPHLAYRAPKGTSRITVAFTSNLIHNSELELMGADQFARHSSKYGAIIAAYAAIIGIVTLVLFLQWISRRRRDDEQSGDLLGKYLFVIISFHGLTFLSLFAMPAFAPQDPSFGFDLTFLAVVLSECAACYFGVIFNYSLAGSPARFAKHVNVLRLVACAIGLLALITQRPVVALLAFALCLFSISLSWYMSLKNDADVSAAKYLKSSWSALCLGCTPLIINYAGVGGDYEIRYFVFAGALIELAVIATLVGQIVLDRERTHSHLQSAYGLNVSAEELNAMVLENRTIDKTTREVQLFTLMTDIKGFSEMMEQAESQTQMFQELTEYYYELTSIIKAKGGILNKTGGDSFFAYFGYGLDGKVRPNAAETAVETAIEIQRRLADLCVNKNFIFPTRIGVHTGYAIIGDLNSKSDLVDYTAVGDVINHTKRFESGCEPFYVLISDEVKEALKETSLDLTERYVQFKHKHHLTKCWEVNPFTGVNSEHYNINRALEAYIQKSRKSQDPRNDCSGDDLWIHIKEPFNVKARVLDFSRGGLRLELDTYLSNGIKLFGSIDDVEVGVEVRWAMRSSRTYSIGAQYFSLSREQMSSLYESMLSKRYEKKAA